MMSDKLAASTSSYNVASHSDSQVASWGVCVCVVVICVCVCVICVCVRGCVVCVSVYESVYVQSVCMEGHIYMLHYWMQ